MTTIISQSKRFLGHLCVITALSGCAIQLPKVSVPIFKTGFSAFIQADVGIEESNLEGSAFTGDGKTFIVGQ